MHIAVGKKADEMHDAAARFGTSHDLLPGLALPDGTGSDGICHQRSALRIDLAGADGVVANLGVAHVVVRWHADRRAVGTQADVRVIGEQTVQRRLAGGGNGTANIRLRDAITVHDDDDDRTGHTGKRGKFRQHGGFLRDKERRTIRKAVRRPRLYQRTGSAM